MFYLECICQKCTCGEHKCPVRLVKYLLPNSMKSIYFQDYKPMSPSKVDVILYEKNRPNIVGGKSIEKNTTYKVCYK